jgi:hypothetical protein
MNGTARRRRVCVSVVAIAIVATVLGVAGIAHGNPTSLAELEGQLLISHGDNFHGQPLAMTAVIRTTHGAYRVRVPMNRHAEFMALSGKPVKLRGTATPTAFAAQTAAQLGGTMTSEAVAQATTKRIAVVMLHTKGSTTEPVTLAQAQANVFGATNSVAEWMNQGSGGTVTVTGKVYGYYDSNYATSDCTDGSTMLRGFLNEAATRAAADGYVASNYDHLVVYSPTWSGTNCGFSGIAWVGANGVLLRGTVNAGVAEHEIGHNMTLWHAGSLACSTGVLTGSCTQSEYGDPIDVMGNAGANRHYSAAHKATLGWLPPAQVVTVNSGSQAVTLAPSENPQAGGTQLVKVQAPNGTVYGVEKRGSSGYDSGLTGVWIRRLGMSSSNGDDTTLLDMTPGSSGGFGDGNLAAGQSFTDSTSGVTITTNSETATSASVTATVGGTPPTSTTTTTKATTTTTTIKPTTTTTTVNPTTTTTTIKPTTTTTTVPPPTPPATVYVSSDGSTVTVTGSGGSDTFLLWKIRNNRLGIGVASGTIVPGANCGVNASGVYCQGKSFVVFANGGDDHITVSGGVRSTQYGGDGNDWLAGGTSTDVFSGGNGFDTVDYSGRTGTIVGTPGTGADDGTSREKDNIMGDVEQVILP